MKSSLHTFLPDLPKLWKIIFLLQVLIHINGFSQFSFYKNYTSNDGLPSSKIYDMLQDSKGYMWFATENGVSRFDGYEFKNFSTDDGLAANSTIRIIEDRNGRIWFASFLGSISYLENNKIVPFSLNEKILALGIPQFFDDIYIDDSETIWLVPNDRGLYRISMDSIIIIEALRSKVFDLPDINNVTLYYFYENGEIVTWTKLKHEATELSDELLKKNVLSIDFPHIMGQPYYQNYQCILDSNDYLFSQGNHLKRIRNGKEVFTMSFQNEILSIYKDDKQNIWISEQFNCLLMYRGGNLENHPIEFLHNISVSKAMQDSEGNYWFSSTDNGIFFVPSIDFASYDMESLNIKNGVVITMETLDNQMFFTTDRKGIHSVIINDGILEYNTNFNIEGFIRSNIGDLLITSEKYLWLSDSEFLIYNLDGSKSSFKPKRHLGGYKLLQLRDKSVVLSHRTGFNIYKGFQLIYKSNHDDFFKRTYPIYETRDSTLILGTFDGVFKYKDGQYSKYDSANPILNSRISDLKHIGEDLWIGTFNNGIVVDTKNEYRYFNEEAGLGSNRIKIIYIENENNIWVGTNKGLNHIELANPESPEYKITTYSIWDGLPSNEINDIIKHKDLMWLGTDKGLVSFNPREVIKTPKSPVLNIDRITVNEKEINPESESFIYSSNENNITFHYAAISFKDPGNITYFYKLDGLEEEWLETRNTSVRYPELKYGEYNFFIKAKNTNGNLSEAVVFNFIILKHFTQTVFFTVIIILLGIGFVSIVFLIILKSSKKREKLKQQVTIAEQKALRAQMNPHFLFNSLNSIQDFVLRRDDKNANFYLTNFSTLMRKILESSKNNTISLSEEIDTLKIYLELEKLRFEGLFDFSFQIDNSINIEEVFIPTMLLQTYVENAIWHGLIPKNAAGLLELNFKKIGNENLMVSIKDNGIGRNKSAEINKSRKHHRSMGMKNSNDRIQLINKLNKSNISIEVMDLYDDNKEAIGTRVVLIFDI